MILFYYAIAVPFFAFLGLLVHVYRGAFNLFPDRGYDNTPKGHYSLIDDILSDNYSPADQFLGTEYDDNGYYELYSLRNLRNNCLISVVCGLLSLICIPGLDALFAHAVDIALAWLWDLTVYRFQNLKLF